VIIQVKKVSRRGSHYVGTEPPEVMGLERDRFVRAAGELRYSLFAVVVSGRLLVSGTLQVRIRAQCSRCAEYFSLVVREPAFLRAYPVSASTEEVDVTPDLREALVLRIPIYPLCREDCRGLCPYCGANLNREECTCSPQAMESRWDVLDKLRL